MISASQFRLKAASTLVLLTMYLILGVYSCTSGITDKIGSSHVKQSSSVFKKAATEVKPFERNRYK
jgi:hypothetical protein